MTLRKKKPKAFNIPVCDEKCETCPFLHGSPLAFVAPSISHSALTERSRICHSTGRSGFKGNTGKPEKLCRGARDIQLAFFHAIGYLDAATDEAWQRKVKEIGLL